jgi:hypothetical protein
VWLTAGFEIDAGFQPHPVNAVVLWQSIGARVTTPVPFFRGVRLIAIASLLGFASLLCLCILNSAIQPRPSDGPVEQWIQFGIDLHRVGELDSMNLFSPHEYKTEIDRVLVQALSVVHHSDFPGTTEEYITYKEQHVQDLTWPPRYWLALGGSLVLSLSSFSWLYGASVAFASCTNKATEQNAEPELPKTGF